MKIAQLNIRSVKNKINYIKDLFNNEKIDILCLQETWLNQDYNFLGSNDYCIYNKIREDGYGGVSIITKSKFIGNIINFDLDHIENIAININVNSISYKIINMYFNPKLKVAEIKRDLDRLTNVLGNSMNIIFCADVNTSHPSWDLKYHHIDRKAEVICDFLNDTMLSTINSGEFTHIHPTTCRAIDITAVSSTLTDKFKWEVSDIDMGSDHLLIFFETINTKESTNNNKIKITNYSRASKILNEKKTEEISNIKNLTGLSNFIENTLNKCTMLVSEKKKLKPWWCEELTKQKNIKNQKLKILKETMNYENYIEFKYERSVFRNLISKNKNKFQKSFLESISPQTKLTEIWKKIKWVTGKGKKSAKEQLSSAEASVFLNKNFSSNAPGTYVNIPLANISDSQIYINVDILNNIINCKKPTAPGYDKITYSLIKSLNRLWKQKICDILNDTISNNNDNLCTLVKIVPIPKSNAEYRPIALIPVFIKIINAHVKNIINEFCKINNVIPKNSFAYQKNKNTIKTIEKLIETIDYNKNKKKGTLVVYFDFSKAYNTVDHRLLIGSLESIKLKNSVIGWIKKFLNSIRIFMETEDGHTMQRLRDGLLQGSVISPVLFNIYTKKLHDLADEDVKIIQFADDFCLAISVGNDNYTDNRIKNKIELFIENCKTLNLNLNSTKTQMQYFPRSNRINSNIVINIEAINQNIELSSVNCVKYLGIYIDKNLNFTEHTKYVKGVVEKRLNCLKFIMGIRKLSHPFTSLNIVKSLIIPIVTYGGLIWYAGGKQNHNPMNVLINKSIRMALGLLNSTKTSYVRSISGVKYIEMLIEEQALKRLCRMESTEVRELLNYNSRYKTDKLIIRKIAKKYIKDENLNEIEDIYKEALESNKRALINNGETELKNKRIEISKLVEYVKKLPGREAKRILRVVGNVVIDTYNLRYWCEICNKRNNIGHKIFCCKLYDLRRPQSIYNKEINYEIKDIVEIISFCDTVGITI